MRVFAAVLAGGEARRMGGVDKCLLEIDGKTILEHIVTRLAPQVEKLALNANGETSRFAHFNLEVLPDPAALSAQGPLSGILAALDWAALQGADAILSVPGDTPFLPRSLVADLAAAMQRETLCAYASSNGQAHPVIALWKIGCRAEIVSALQNGMRKVRAVQENLSAVDISFDAYRVEIFRGANTPDDLAALRAAAPQLRMTRA